MIWFKILLTLWLVSFSLEHLQAMQVINPLKPPLHEITIFGHVLIALFFIYGLWRWL